jgi:hypothetical protein
MSVEDLGSGVLRSELKTCNRAPDKSDLTTQNPKLKTQSLAIHGFLASEFIMPSATIFATAGMIAFSFA